MANDATRGWGAEVILSRIASFIHGHWSLVIGHSLLFAFLLSSPHASAATRFEDVTLSVSPLATGDTLHGYLEHRVTVQNESPSRAHRVTLIMPDESYSGWGNGLRALSRTVTVGPGASATVSLWQPAVHVAGDNSMRVLIDGRKRGKLTGVHTRHAVGGRSASEAETAKTLLISRSLNSDDLDSHLRGDTTAAPFVHYSPSMATGAPNTAIRGGLSATAWYPERHNNGAEWLHLDYSTPLKAGQVRIYMTEDERPELTVVLEDSAGRSLGEVKATNSPVLTGSSCVWTVSFPVTTNAVSRVKLNFNTTSVKRGYGIDAVELVGPDARAWASSATASAFYNSGAWGGGRGGRGPGAVKTPTVLRAESEVSGWSEQWLAYTPFDAVIVKDSDFAAMPGAVQAALWRYAETGGSLAVLGKVTVPEPWNATRYELNKGVTRHSTGFGILLELDASSTKALLPAQVKALTDAARAAVQPWVNLRNEQTANTAFPVVADMRIPVRGLVFLMLLFIIVIGPGNIFVLHRMQKKIWLLWTVPVMSFAACLVLFVYSLLSEGITAHVRTEGLTLLDQVNHRATTLGITAIYAPLTPNDGVRFSYDTEVTPLMESSGRGGGGAPRDLDWSEGQHLQRGWVTARVPAHFQLRKSETRRERIALEKMPDGKLAVVNGLGAHVEKLFVADRAGVLRRASDLAPGQKAPLADTGTTVSGNLTGSQRQGWFHGDWGNLTDAIMQEPGSFVGPGTYIAVLSDAPFIEKALGPKAPVRARQVVYGILEPEGAKP